VFVPLLPGSTVLSWPLRALLPVWVFDTLAVATVLLGVPLLVPNPRLAVVAGAIALAVLIGFLLADFSRSRSGAP